MPLTAQVCSVVGFRHLYLFDPVALPYHINHFQAFHHFSKAGMITVKMGGVGAAMADEELRAPGVSSRVGHGEYTTIVVLVIAVEFAFYRVSRAAGAGAVGAASLYDKIRYHPVKGESVIESFLCKIGKILYSAGSILFE